MSVRLGATVSSMYKFYNETLAISAISLFIIVSFHLLEEIQESLGRIRIRTVRTRTRCIWKRQRSIGVICIGLFSSIASFDVVLVVIFLGIAKFLSHLFDAPDMFSEIVECRLQFDQSASKFCGILLIGPALVLLARSLDDPQDLATMLAVLSGSDHDLVVFRVALAGDISLDGNERDVRRFR